MSQNLYGCGRIEGRASTSEKGRSMHPSIEQYLEFLHTKRRAPATLKVIRQDLAHFVAWWESHRRRTFDPALLRHEDLRDWRVVRQRDDGTAPATSLPWEDGGLDAGTLDRGGPGARTGIQRRRRGGSRRGEASSSNGRGEAAHHGHDTR